MVQTRYLHIVLYNVSTLTNNTKFIEWVEQRDLHSQGKALIVKQDENKYLQALFDYYQSHNLTSVVRPTSLKYEYEFVDMTEGEQLLL